MVQQNFPHHSTNIDLLSLVNLIKALKSSSTILLRCRKIIISLVFRRTTEVATQGGTSDHVGDTNQVSALPAATSKFAA
jgi:hypothetical protein